MGVWGHRRETGKCHRGQCALPFLASALEMGTLLWWLSVPLGPCEDRLVGGDVQEWCKLTGRILDRLLLMECASHVLSFLACFSTNFPLGGQRNTEQSGKSGRKASSVQSMLGSSGKHISLCIREGVHWKGRDKQPGVDHGMVSLES